MRRRAIAVLLLVAAGMLALLLLEVEKGRAREPVPRRAAAPEARASELICAAPEEEAATAAKSVALSGTVRDERGRPIPGARVRLFKDRLARESNAWRDDAPDAGDPAYVLTADAHGGFVVTASNGTPWTLVADAPEFVPAVVPVPQGIEGADFPITLARGATFRLRAVDPDGKPLPDAEALVFHKGDTLRTSVHADAEGWIEARLAPLELLLVRAPGYSWELAEPPLDAPEVILDREYRLGGVVVSADGEPVPGVRLSFDRYLWVEDHVTDKDGRFLIVGLASAEFAMRLDVPGEDDFRVETVQPGDERVRIVLDAARVEGIVLLPDGSPAAGAEIDLGTTHRWRSAADGSFVVERVPKGDIEVRASLGDVRPPDYEARQRVTVAGSGVTKARLVLRQCPHSFVSVLVVGPDGEVVHDRVKTSVFSNGEYCNRQCYNDGAGRQTVDVALAPGGRVRVACELVPADYSNDPARRLKGADWAVTQAAPEGQGVTVRLLTPVDVTVVCRDADGSAVPSGFQGTIHVEGLDYRTSSEGGGRYRVRMDAATTGREPEARAALLVEASGYAPLRIDPWTPQAGGEVEVRLRRAIPIRGRIVGHDGAPRGAHVQLYGAGRPTQCEYMGVDAGGHFVREAAPGEVVMLVVSNGGIPGQVQRIEVPLGGAVDVGDIPFEPPWVARGVLVGEDGTPVGGAIVRVVCPGYEGSSVSRGDGTFVLDMPPWEGVVVHVVKRGLAVDPVPTGPFLRAPQTIRMHPVATLVLEAAGIEDARVHRPGSGVLWQPNWTRDGNEVTLEPFAPGRLVVDVTLRDGTVTREVDLAPGRTTRIVLGR